MGASPIVVDDGVVLACDQSTGSFIAAFDGKTGKERWRTARPEARSGHSTPIVYRPAGGFLTAEQWRGAIEAAGFADVRFLPDILRVRERVPDFYVAAIGATRPG